MASTYIIWSNLCVHVPPHKQSLKYEPFPESLAERCLHSPGQIMIVTFLWMIHMRGWPVLWWQLPGPSGSDELAGHNAHEVFGSHIPRTVYSMSTLCLLPSQHCSRYATQTWGIQRSCQGNRLDNQTLETRCDGRHQPCNFATSPARCLLSNGHVGYHHGTSEHHGGGEQSHASHGAGAAGDGDSGRDDPAVQADTTGEEIASTAVS